MALDWNKKQTMSSEIIQLTTNFAVLKWYSGNGTLGLPQTGHKSNGIELEYAVWGVCMYGCAHQGSHYDHRLLFSCSIVHKKNTVLMTSLKAE